jgi:hypothetical protein
MHSLIKSDDELFGLELLIRDIMRRMKTKMSNHFCNLPRNIKETTRPEWFLVVRTV